MNRRSFVQQSAQALALVSGLHRDVRASQATETVATKVITFPYARATPRSPLFKVWAAGQEQLVFQTSVGAFATFASAGTVDVVVELPAPAREVRIAPARHGVTAGKEGNRLRFRVPVRANLLIEVDGHPHLFLFVNAIESGAPEAAVHHFKAGQVYEVGELRLRDNETVYIEGGAVVRGCIRATGARNVRVAGHGVLDGGYYKQGVDSRRSIVFEGCRDSRIQDIVMIEPSSWMIMLGACEDVTVSNVKELGFVSGSDGVDIVGSRRIRVENGFLRNGDDCIAIKSLDMRRHGKDASVDFTRDVEDIEVSGCSFMAYLGGQAMEVGHELRCASVKGIRFRDCDVLKKPNYGAPFGIHNADRATVSDVLFENIRVEHHYDKLVDFRIVESRWSGGKGRGHVRNVTLRNIDAKISEFNPGYTTSLIGGFDSKHKIIGVTFDNFRLNGKRVTRADDLDLYTRHAEKISFR
jgi:hypothetical protein